MKFPEPLIKATLIKRYKRFLADVELKDGTLITVHCPNPGSMIGVKEPGSPVWISNSNNPKRKLRYTFELIETANSLVGINTNMANKIVEEAILSRKFSVFDPFEKLRREVKYGKNSRIDFLLTRPDAPDTYVEVKSVTLQRTPGLHEFPDGVTERGRKHLGELADMVRAGHRAIMLYLIQREDGDKFSLAGEIDPLYLKAFNKAVALGVEAIAIRCKMSETEIVADKLIKIHEAVMRQTK